MDRNKVRELYLKGFSCRKVGDMLGISRYKVIRVCKDIMRDSQTKDIEARRNQSYSQVMSAIKKR